MRSYRFLLLTVSMLFLIACSGSDEIAEEYSTEPNYGDTFVEATISDPVILNPLLYTDGASGDIIDYIFEGMITYDPFNNIKGELAESWEVIKNEDILMVHLTDSSGFDAGELRSIYEENRKGFGDISEIITISRMDTDRELILEVRYSDVIESEEIAAWYDLHDNVDFVDYRYDIEFSLKSDIKWSDGKSLTSADVLFTYEKIIDPKTQSPRKKNYTMIKQVEAPDRYTIYVQYLKPFAPALQSWMMNIIPKHIVQAELEDLSMSEIKFNRFPVGTNSYKLVQWIPDEYILLEANSRYHEGKPYIEKVMVKNIPDKSQQFLDLKNGLIDYMSMTPDQFTKQVNTGEFEERFNLFKMPSSTYYSFVGYNCGRAPFNSKKVRQALSYAIDVQAIIDSVFYGMGKRVTGPFPVISWAYNQEAKGYDYNPELARTLLKEEGYTDTDGDGILDKDGEKLKIELMTNNGNKEREYMVMIIKDYWKRIGIEVETSTEEWGKFLEFQDKGNFDAVLLGWGLALDPDIYNIWHSDNIPNEEHPTSFNFVRYQNSEVDKLLEKGRYTFDQNLRKETYHRVHELIAEDQPYTFLIAEDSLTVLDKRFHGVEKKGRSVFWNFEKWFVPKAMVRYK